MNTLKGWNQKLMVSFWKKEGSYDAALTVNATNFCSVKGHSDYKPDWSDEVQTDKDTVTGYEHGTDLDVINQVFKVQIEQKNAKPNFVIGAMAGALGSITTSQDSSYTAYVHKCVPVAAGSTLPSFNLIGLKGGLQYLHKGCKVNSVTISGEEGKAVSCTLDIIGSGSRATNAESFVAEPSESWMLAKNGYVWLESGASISIGATNTQGSEDISSGTPRDLKALIKKFTFKWNNDLQGQFGFGAENNGVYQDLDFGRRSAELTMDLRHADGTDLAYYLNETVLAAEIEVKGAVIQAGGSYCYGFSLRIPRFKLKKAPLPEGGLNDALTLTYEADIQDDGTNPAVIFEGYNAKPSFLVA